MDACGALPRPSERASGAPPNARAAKHLRPSGPLRRRSFASSLARGVLCAEQGCPPTARRGRAPLTASGRPRERRFAGDAATCARWVSVGPCSGPGVRGGCQELSATARSCCRSGGAKRSAWWSRPAHRSGAVRPAAKLDQPVRGSDEQDSCEPVVVAGLPRVYPGLAGRCTIDDPFPIGPGTARRRRQPRGAGDFDEQARRTFDNIGRYLTRPAAPTTTL